MKGDIERLYSLIENLKDICCKKRWTNINPWTEIILENCDGRMDCWKKSKRGVYLFFNHDEKRSDGKTHRIVRVGTHSIKSAEGEATLWKRLKQHKGNDSDGAGNHRGSIFRLLVGDALIKRDGEGPATWGQGSKIPENHREKSDAESGGEEPNHEKKVSEYIRKLPFLFVKVDPKNNGAKDRKYLENNLIALISNINRKSRNQLCPDLPSPEWLGHHSTRDAVRDSALWNNNGTKGNYDSKSLDLLKHYIEEMRNGAR